MAVLAFVARVESLVGLLGTVCCVPVVGVVIFAVDGPAELPLNGKWVVLYQRCGCLPSAPTLWVSRRATLVLLTVRYQRPVVADREIPATWPPAALSSLHSAGIAPPKKRRRGLSAVQCVDMETAQIRKVVSKVSDLFIAGNDRATFDEIKAEFKAERKQKKL